MDFKRYFVVVLMLSLFSCEEEDEIVTPARQLEIDGEIIDNYLQENGINNAVTDKSGLRYVVDAQGDGKFPTETSNVTVRYEGRLLSNGQVFDSNNTGVEFPLNRLILGWQIGIPKIQEGGKITLYVPSGLAYGPRGSGAIPGNAVLIFDIELLSVN